MSSVIAHGRPGLLWLLAQVACLPPAAFAMVMATGILSIATDELGRGKLSLAFLVVAAAAYAILSALTGWRLLVFPSHALGDARSPEQAFGYFTFVAGTNLLALRLSAAGWTPVAEALGLVAAASWLLLSYGLVAVLVTDPGGGTPWRSVNGTWLVWVVGTQSVAGAAAVAAPAHPPEAQALALAATGVWAAGAVLYLLLMALMIARLLLVDLTPEELGPDYWITMGAAAITVLVAADLLGAAQWLPVHPGFVRDVGFMLWAFGTWWIPLLVVLGVWRHVLRRVPLRYDTALWAMVFPLGMYAAASQSYGTVAGLRPLQAVADIEVWFAIASWTATFVAMLIAAFDTFARWWLSRADAGGGASA
ncbi:MAG TPA: tellurite resistance/C4-dicarboxylate transporter family protein [Candidatus Dormibacteraeota bacterium]|nr:tellurite resistance/C4-dicarboxylate transporter family protein [Candidatus Dormibacteraeota bacterium]